MALKPELKPCPFCGGERIETTMSFIWRGEETGEGRKRYYGLCMSCLTNGPERGSHRTAAISWNRRAVNR